MRVLAMAPEPPFPNEPWRYQEFEADFLVGAPGALTDMRRKPCFWLS